MGTKFNTVQKKSNALFKGNQNDFFYMNKYDTAHLPESITIIYH